MKKKRPITNRRKAAPPRGARTGRAVTVLDVESKQTVVPLDENLLERARTQWQFGDWQSLARLQRETLQHHPDRSRLALLAAAGRLQTGQIAEARHFIRLAQDWGASKRLVCQMLTAGAHNSLARAAALAGNFPRAIRNFEASVTVGTPGADERLLTQARVNQQYDELGLQQPMSLSHQAKVIPVEPHIVPVLPRFNVARQSVLELGDAWASNTINTVIFRHHGILTHQGRQTAAFYVDENTLQLVQRDLVNDHVHAYDIVGQYNLRDAHNSISLGVDRAGHLHICYDHHATRLRYRRTVRPNDITGWTNELSMTGEAEDRITYPTFIQPHHGFPLTLLYRDGCHIKGDVRLKSYDERTENWVDNPLSILSGSDLKPWTSNAYWNHPAIGSDGSLHLSFVWRTHTLGTEERLNNINVCYARSPDNGFNWLTSKDRAYRLPITQVNAETVYPISPGSNLINQCSMALDSHNRPHIVFYADDANEIPQYQHLWYDGKQWRRQVISRRTRPFSLKGGGTLRIPMSRPEIVIDSDDNAYVITRGDHSEGRMVATMLAAPDYTWSPDETQVLWDEDLGFAEPVIDRIRWAQDNVLTVLVQYNEQPNHDFGHRSMSRPIRLVDIQLKIDRS